MVPDQLRRFMLKRVPPLQLPASMKQWDQEAARIRTRELSVLYHGWPQAWIDAAPNFEQVGVIEREGYRIVKLRYQVVPGMFSTALLYEPDKISGKVPAILNVNGHGPGGKAVGHKQARCINYARRAESSRSTSSGSIMATWINPEMRTTTHACSTWPATTELVSFIWKCGADSTTSTTTRMSIALASASRAFPEVAGNPSCSARLIRASGLPRRSPDSVR